MTSSEKPTMYADFLFYTGAGFNTVTELAFPRLAMLASRHIDLHTPTQIHPLIPSMNIKLLCCNLVDILSKEINDEKEVSSVSAGNYSESYVTSAQAKSKMDDLYSLYLTHEQKRRCI